TSRLPMIVTATPRATNCCAPWPRRSAPPCASPTPPAAMAATNSACSCTPPRRTRRATWPKRSWPRSGTPAPPPAHSSPQASAWRRHGHRRPPSKTGSTRPTPPSTGPSAPVATRPFPEPRSGRLDLVAALAQACEIAVGRDHLAQWQHRQAHLVGLQRLFGRSQPHRLQPGPDVARAQTLRQAGAGDRADAAAVLAFAVQRPDRVDIAAGPGVGMAAHGLQVGFDPRQGAGEAFGIGQGDGLELADRLLRIVHLDPEVHRVQRNAVALGHAPHFAIDHVVVAEPRLAHRRLVQLLRGEDRAPALHATIAAQVTLL